jgi:putative tRNA adenosine deaminase-associated protein
MWPVAYFTAVIARAGDAWRAKDVELDEYDNLDDLADALRAVARDDQPVLAVIEHEDEWFAIVRVDGDDEPRLFVSDLLASARSHYGHMLASAADVDSEEELGGGEDDDDDQPVDDEGALPVPVPVPGDDDPDDDGDDPEDDGDATDAVHGEDLSELDRPMLAAWAGEIELLEDLGFSAKALRRLAEEHGDDPATVLAEVGEVVGFAELLEALR